jgi:tetratricopeptide (TPR) repeat protein
LTRSCLEIGAHGVTLTNVMRFEHPLDPGIVAATLRAAVFGLILAIPMAGAAQTADSTDEAALLAQLAQSSPAEAKRIDRQLTALWSRSGSPAMDLLLKRGRDALEEGDLDAAIDHLTALTDHAPDFAEGWHARAMAFYAMQMFGPAVADLERALALNPNNYNAILGLAAVFETFGDEARAYEVYSRVLAIHPHHEDVTKAAERLRPRTQGAEL